MLQGSLKSLPSAAGAGNLSRLGNLRWMGREFFLAESLDEFLGLSCTARL